MAKYKEFDRKYLVLQPYFEIVNQHFAENCIPEDAVIKNKKRQPAHLKKNQSFGGS